MTKKTVTRRQKAAKATPGVDVSKEIAAAGARIGRQPAIMLDSRGTLSKVAERLDIAEKELESMLVDVRRIRTMTLHELESVNRLAGFGFGGES